MKVTEPTNIVLDTGPLGGLTSPVDSRLSNEYKAWYVSLEDVGCYFYVPQIADYEVRRNLHLEGMNTSIIMLDEFIHAEADRYLRLTAEEIDLASQFWGQLRNAARGGSDEKALDGDVLIAAQARALEESDPFTRVVVATGNVKHFRDIAFAELWSDIRP